MMSASAVIPPLRNNLDFTDENVYGLKMSSPYYTSFENQLKNRQMASSAALFSDLMFSQPKPAAIATRSIDMSLARSTKPKAAAERLAKLKESEPIDYKVQQPVIPDDVPVYTLTVDSSKVICFYGRDNFLSNYFTSPMTVNGVAYRTVEHYYEACKLFSFGGFQWSSQLNIVKDAGAAKATSKRMMMYVDKRRVEAWKRTEGLDVVENALTQKFKQNADLAQKLLETGDAYLAHCNPHDKLWATALNAEKVSKEWAPANQGVTLKIPREMSASTLAYYPTTWQGQNALGYLLMQIRRDLLEKKRTGGGGDKTSESASFKVASSQAKAPQAPVGTAVAKTFGTAVGSSALGADDNNNNLASASSGGGASTLPSTLGGDSSDHLNKLCAQLSQINTKKVGGI